MVNYEDLSRIMIKRINEINKNFLDIDINLSLTISQELVNQIINYLISLGGIDYIRNRNGFYNNLKNPTKNKKQTSISVLSGALLVLFSGKKENEETTIKKIFDSYDKDYIIEIPTIPELDRLSPDEPPLSTPREPPPEQEILDLSFIPTSAQKQVYLPINIKYDPVLERERFREKRRLNNMGLRDFDAPEREGQRWEQIYPKPKPVVEEEEEKEEVKEEEIPEEEEENLTEGQKRALTKINATRQEIAWLPNPEDEEDGGEWMDFEEADGEDVLDQMILKGSIYIYQEENDGELPEVVEEEVVEEEDVVEEEEVVLEEEILGLVEETERILDTPFTPVAPPEIIQPNILDYGNLDGSIVPSPVVLSSPSVSSVLSEMDNLSPEDYAQMPVYTKKGNIVEPQYRKQENENRGTKRVRLWNRRRIRNKESLGRFERNAFDINEVYSEFLRGNIKETAKTEEELPNWLDEIMEADWTAVVPNYEVVSEDRPKTGDMLIDVIERRVEEFSYQVGGEEALGMPTENYTKYQVLESNLDLEEFVGRNWKDKMRLNLRAIQRKKMRNQPYKKDLPLGERTLEFVDEY